MKVSEAKENKKNRGKGTQRKQGEGQEQNYTIYVKLSSKSWKITYSWNEKLQQKNIQKPEGVLNIWK